MMTNEQLKEKWFSNTRLTQAQMIQVKEWILDQINKPRKKEIAPADMQRRVGVRMNPDGTAGNIFKIIEYLQAKDGLIDQNTLF